MAVCNIFNRLRSNTGTYFMFSQYAEDLTRESVQSSYYRVTPSKFIALELDVNEYNDDTIARLLQNKFENGCAVCRKEMVDTWVPNHSTNLFWDTLFDAFCEILHLKQRYSVYYKLQKALKHLPTHTNQLRFALFQTNTEK